MIWFYVFWCDEKLHVVIVIIVVYIKELFANYVGAHNFVNCQKFKCICAWYGYIVNCLLQ